jgi:ABC-type phosphate/phosphonate transport system substrate-binding protein
MSTPRSGSNSGAAARTSCGLLAVLLLSLAPAGAFAADAAPAPGRIELHFAFSKAMFSEVNENDAQAAMKVYAESIGDQNGIYISSEPDLLMDTNAILRAIEAGKVQMFALTTEDFLALEGRGLDGPLLLSSFKQAVTEEYVLLVQEKGSLREVEDLKGRNLVISSDIRASLALPWLEVLCREHGLGPAQQALGKITPATKATQVVLPVFFGKADACIVTRNGWEVMSELNPQVGKQLRAIAVSPPVVPALTCFRGGLAESVKQQIIGAVELSSTRPSYQQLMALFKFDAVGYHPPSALDSTRELLATHARLRAGTNSAAAFGTSVPVARVNGGGN